MDDIVLKNKKSEQYVKDLTKVFNILKRYNFKLNSEKCVFRVSIKKRLGFMVLQKGIEANPEKIQAILDMQTPKNVKVIQRLTWQVLMLSNFMSKSIDKYLLFFSNS